MEGWIKLHRKLVDNRLWLSEPFTRGQAWVDMLLLANHQDSFFRIRGVRVDIKRGQLGHSIPKLAERWKWSKGKVKRFLDELETDSQIDPQKNNVTSVITIVNYNAMQGGDTADGSANGVADGVANGSQTDLNKNVKNVKNEKKIIDLAKESIDTVKQEPSLYSIINKYKKSIGEDNLIDILSGCLERNNHFSDESKLAAYLEKCIPKQLTDNLPQLNNGAPSWL